jgi:hypothetical protein
MTNLLQHVDLFSHSLGLHIMPVVSKLQAVETSQGNADIFSLSCTLKSNASPSTKGKSQAQKQQDQNDPKEG